jgi:predicted transcriptional regulator
MAEDPPSRVDPNQVAEIVTSYLRHHQIAPDQLPGLIVEVHRALAGLGRVTPGQQPAVPIRRSVQQDFVVCLECGFARRCCARICGSRMGSQSPITAPAGNCRSIIH